MKNYFSIKNQNDVYAAVGQIVKAAQEMETEYKKFAKLIGVQVENFERGSMSKINKALRTQKVISVTDFKDLEKAIDLRYYVYHEFFLKDFYDLSFMEIDDSLNKIYLTIFEASDTVAGLIERTK